MELRSRIGLEAAAFLILCQPFILYAEKVGWPIEVGDDIHSSPALADIDGDGKLEVIAGVCGAKGSGDGILFVWRCDGTPYPKWPQTVAGRIQGASPVVGDLDPEYDGMEIVVCTSKGKVYLWHNDGTVMDGWPKTLPGAVCNSPVVIDFNRDGQLDIVVSCADGKVYAYTGSGDSLSGWPKDTGAPVSSVVVQDINSDGKMEVLAGNSQGKIYLWDAKGQVIPGWPKDGASKVAVGDFDPKYKGLEIVCVTQDKVNLLHSDGTSLSGWPKVFPAPGIPAIGDIDEDGLLEVVLSSDPGTNAPARMYAFRADGSAVSGWPVDLSTVKGYAVGGAPVLADLDGDGKLEIIAGSSCYSIHAWHHNGTQVQNFPIKNIGMQYYSPAIADLDNNGRLEIVFGDVSSILKVHVYEVPFYYR